MEEIKKELGHNKETLAALSLSAVQHMNTHASDFQRHCIQDATNLEDLGYTLIKYLMTQESQPLNKLIIGLGKSHGISGTREAAVFGMMTIHALRGKGLYELHKYHDDDLIDMFETDDVKHPTWKVRRAFTILNPKITMKANMVEFLPPLLCEPAQWTDSQAGGYHSIRNKRVLGNVINKVSVLPSDVANKLQSIKWVIDEDIAQMQEPISEGVKGLSRKVMKETSAKLYTWLKDKPFYFAWTPDYRGRMYSKGYHLNVQGTEFKKAMIKHAHKEVLTDEGMKWLKIDIANHFGMDKLTFEQRLAFFDEKIKTGAIKYTDADDQHLAYRAMKAYNQGLKGEEVAINTYMDATASGLQIYSALTSDATTAKLCNMNNQDRADIYSMVAQTMSTKMGVSISRKNIKKSVMTFFYGKMEADIEHDENNHIDIGSFNPKVFNMVFQETMLTLAPEAVNAMNTMYAIRDISSTEYTWTMPDGFVVNYKVMGKKHKTSVGVKGFASTNIIYQDNEAYEYSRALAPNVIHSIDGYIVREMVRRCDFEVSTIHDSFSCHPNNMGVLTQTYNKIMQEINASDLLADILSSIAGRKLTYDKPNTLTSAMISASPYALS